MSDVIDKPPSKAKPPKPPKPPKRPKSTILEPVARLSRDIRKAALELGDAEARFLVDAYYLLQDDRKRAYAQERALGTNREPNLVIQWLADQSDTLEKQIAGALDTYTIAHPMGSFMRGIYGIGPVISAGFLAHIYMGDWCGHVSENGGHCRGRDEADCQRRQNDDKRKPRLDKHVYKPEEATPTAGHIWHFAGIAGDNQRRWEKGTRRPFNAALKTLCWKLGQSFMKFSNVPECEFGHLYRSQKQLYVERNGSGAYRERALERASRVGPRTEAHKHYSGGALPPGHVDAMARRWVVKRFLADLHLAWYWQHYGKLPPLPYPVAILGHGHYTYNALRGIPDLWAALMKHRP